jgi:hypothetical protein
MYITSCILSRRNNLSGWFAVVMALAVAPLLPVVLLLLVGAQAAPGKGGDHGGSELQVTSFCNKEKPANKW